MSWICPKCETENSERLTICEVCDTPRDISPADKLKEELNKKYSDAAYKQFIRYHYDLLASADKGNSVDQYKVGEWFFSRGNIGVADDISKIAVGWYLEAAKQGHTAAQTKLALCYKEGRGVYKAIDAAIKWYQEAASKGDETAIRQYLELKYSSDTYKQIIKYRMLLMYAADKCNVNSQYIVGEWFSSHNSQSSYREEAFSWYEKAAKGEHVGAMLKLGECFENGIGVYSNYSEAIKWYKKAAKGGNTTAQLRLARAYLYGTMVPKNVEESLKWYELAGRGFGGEDLCNIGYSYDIGDTVSVDKYKAIEYYRQAAEKGSSVAEYNLGVCYENGTGVTRDIGIARYWYEKAASKGNSDAAQNLQRLNTVISNGEKDFFDDCLSPAATFGAVLFIAYHVIAAFTGWPGFSTKEGLFVERNLIPALIFIIPTIVLTIIAYDE